MITTNYLVHSSHSLPKPHLENDPLGDLKAEIGRLIHAAIINKRFRQMLLKDPKRSIENGYCGERFHFPHEFRQRIECICAESIEEFSAQALNALHTPCIQEMVPISCQTT